jgi:translocation and assembly module TamB
LTRCDIKSGDGSLHGSGRMMFGKGLIGGNLESASVEFTADNFVVADSRDIQMVVNGNATLSGDVRTPAYSGHLTVVQSRLWIPRFTDQIGTKQETSVPLLIAAIRPADSLTAKKTGVDSAKKYQLDYLKNLHGSLKLSVPRNTWLRSPDMQIEISGDIEVDKPGEDFELFGEIQTVRGWYEVLGKRFEIESGTLAFQGGKEYNPDLNIEAQYTFRDEAREERALMVHITGKAFKPKFDFALDEKHLDLSDAVAYITFGKPFNSLSLGQKSSSSEQGIALGFAARQLSSALGNATGLDVLEIRGGETIGQSTIAVGKYISNDLFMSIEKQLGSGETDNPSTQVITLEYELTKYLFLQLIQGDVKKSGFDVFVKVEK